MKTKKIKILLIVLIIFLFTFKTSYSAKIITIPTPKVIKMINISFEEEQKIKYYNIPLSKELQEYIYKLSEKYNLDYELVLAVIKLESQFDIMCINKNKNSIDQGLMQINSKYEEWYAGLAKLEKHDVFDPYDNIKMGVAGLSFFKNYWGNKGYKGDKLTKLTLLSYNRGINNTKKYISRYGYNHAYTKKVLQYKNEFLNNIQ